MFTNTELNSHPPKEDGASSIGRVEEPSGVRKPLFSKPTRKDGSGVSKLLKEMEKMNSTMELILNTQKAMQVCYGTVSQVEYAESVAAPGQSLYGSNELGPEYVVFLWFFVSVFVLYCMH